MIVISATIQRLGEIFGIIFRIQSPYNTSSKHYHVYLYLHKKQLIGRIKKRKRQEDKEKTLST
jgi:hypothetical protein